MIKIRGELPQFRRCCMCLPLRLGLIIWGYVRLVVAVILLIEVTESFFEILAISKNETGYELYLVLYGYFVLLEGADIVLNVVFVYAGHTKDLKMLKAYYIYSFVFMIILITMGIYVTIRTVNVMKKREMNLQRVWIILCDVTTVIAQIWIQAYLILLVRSELIKLSNNCEFRFVNNAAESACKMEYDEDGTANEDTVNEDIITNNDSVANEEEVGLSKNGTSQPKDIICILKFLTWDI